MPYSLGALGYAVGTNANDTTKTLLASTCRGSAALTKMSQFIANISFGGSTTTIVAGATATWYLRGEKGTTFTGNEFLWDTRVRNQTKHFSSCWKFLIGTGSGDASYAYNPTNYSEGTLGAVGFGTASIKNEGAVGDYNETLYFAYFDHFHAYATLSWNVYIDIAGGES